MSHKQLTHEEVKRSQEKFPLTLWAVDMQKTENVGSLFRLADGLGVAKLILVGDTPAPPNKKISKVARSADNSVEWAHLSHHQGFELLEDFYTSKFDASVDTQIVLGLEITNDSIPVQDWVPENPVMTHLILGNEEQGISQDYLNLCHKCVHIPMHGQNSSLNVSIAAAIASYQITQYF